MCERVSVSETAATLAMESRLPQKLTSATTGIHATACQLYGRTAAVVQVLAAAVVAAAVVEVVAAAAVAAAEEVAAVVVVVALKAPSSELRCGCSGAWGSPCSEARASSSWP